MNDEQQLITIVIPVRNRAELVTRTLDSVARQTDRNFRLIVVDNASTDATREVVARWIADNTDSGIPMELLDEATAGAAAARNCGLRSVVTPYVMFFDSDDEMRPDHMSRIIAELRRRPDTELLRWDVGILDPDGWLIVKSPRFHNEVQLNLLHGSLSTLRYAVRTDLLRMAGAWNEELSTWDDLELGNRLLIKGVSVRKLDGEPTAIIHPTPESISGKDHAQRIEPIIRSLDTIERTLRELPDTDTDYLNTLDARRAITAATLRRQGQREAADKIMATAMNGHSAMERLQLRIISTIVRIAGCGGSAAALFFFGKKAEKR